MAYVERTLEALRELALSAGGLGRAGGDAGLSKNTFRNWERSGTFGGRRVGCWLDSMQVEPLRFSRYAFAPLGSDVMPEVLAFGAEAREIAYDKKRSVEPVAVGAARLAYLQGSLSVTARPTAEEEARMAAIDDLRDGAPEAAAEQARVLVDQASCLETVARGLRLWSECLRPLRQLDRAQLLVWAGLRLAGAEASPATARLWDVEIQLLRKAATLLYERGRLDEALALAQGIVSLQAPAGATDSVGRSHLVVAVVHFARGEYVPSAQAYRRALACLETESTRFRAAAHHGLATVSVETGDLAAAETHAVWAQQAARPGSQESGALLALRGWIAARAGDHRAALGFFDAALPLLRHLPVETLLLSAESLRAQLQTQGPELACRRARELVPLLGRLEQDPVLGAALADLIRAGMEGEAALSLEVVDRVVKRVHEHLSDLGRATLIRPAGWTNVPSST